MFDFFLIFSDLKKKRIHHQSIFFFPNFNSIQFCLSQGMVWGLYRKIIVKSQSHLSLCQRQLLESIRYLVKGRKKRWWVRMTFMGKPEVLSHMARLSCSFTPSGRTYLSLCQRWGQPEGLCLRQKGGGVSQEKTLGLSSQTEEGHSHLLAEQP